MSELQQVLTTTFVIGLFAAGMRLAIPIFLAALGEIITERGGVLNLGLEGIMLVGAFAGFAAAFYAQESLPAGAQWLAPWLGLAAGTVAGMLMGLLMAVLAVTLQTDQVIAGIMLVVLGTGMTTYFYRQWFGSLTARVESLPPAPIPVLADIPVLGPILFRHDLMTYLSLAVLLAGWYFLFRTTWGLNLRAAGELPAAADTSGVNVAAVRYAAVLIGAALTGLGGAVLTVAQLGIFSEGITAGRGWIAVALVIFANWRPGPAFAGAFLFGLATALQFRIQALNIPSLPYELLLMLPYVLTILALLVNSGGSQAPAALGKPYVKE